MPRRLSTDVVLGTQPYAIYDAESTTLYLCQSDQTLIAGNQFTPAGSDTPITIDNVWYGKDVCETAANGGTREYNLPWHKVYETTTKTVIEPSFANVRPTRTDTWFYYFYNMTSIDGLEYLNTSEVTTMYEMFNNCESLQSLSGIENYDVSKVVDMECSALAACAEFRGAKFAQLFFTADSLADVKNYDRRSFGESSREKALDICMDVIAGME